MTTTPAPQTYKLLRCPEAIPTRSWLRSSVLWADSLSAIWPQGEPDARTPSEQDALADIAALERARLFAPELAPDLSAEADHLDDELLRLTSAETSLWRTSWQLPEQGAAAPGADEFATTLMNGKLSAKTVRQLRKRKLLHPAEGGQGYIASERSLVPWLITSAAQLVAQRSPDTIPVPSGHFQAIAEPANEADADLGLHLSLPALPPVRNDIPMDKLLDLRADGKFDRRRRAYLEHLSEVRTTLAEKYADQGAAAVQAQFVAQQTAALAATYVTYRSVLSDHASTFDFRAEIATDAVGLVLNLGAGDPPSLPWQLLTVGAAFLATPVLIRRSAPAFLRTVSSLLEPPAR